MADNKSDTVAEEIETIRNAERLAETKFSKLFHQARTTSRDPVTGVTVQVRVTDGELEVHDSPVKTRRGEHLRGNSGWDFRVSLPVRAFLETETARQEITRQLKEFERKLIQAEQREMYQ